MGKWHSKRVGAADGVGSGRIVRTTAGRLMRRVCP